MRKIKKLFVNLLCMMIRDKNKRHHMRHMIMDFIWTDFFRLLYFRYKPVRNKCILLVECNDCHGEVIGGYINYFQNLGYPVDILINSSIKKENPFIRLDMKDINVFDCFFGCFNLFFKSSKIMNYQHVVVMSSACYHFCNGNKYECILTRYPALKKHPSLIMVEHDLKDVEAFQENTLLQNNKLITLGEFKQGVYVNPHLFGERKITPKNKQTTFITVGAIKAFRKNHQALIEAIEILAKQGLDFKVTVVGGGNLDFIPPAIKKYIRLTGRLNFPEMFDEMEQADFFLPLLDADNPDHERYITTGVTGSAQLIYAFGKIPLIHKKFADFYRFNKDNALIYQSDLAGSMKQAISLSATEYKKLQSNLIDTAKTIRAQSTRNLKDALK